MSAMSDLARLSRLAPGDSRGAYVRASADDVPADEDVERKRDGSKSPRGGGRAVRSRSLKHFVCLVGIFVVATAVAFVAVNLSSVSGLLPDYNAATGTVHIKKSPSDKREYKFFIMPSGLQVLAVSDPTADRAAASMDVSVGSFSDPPAFPGLAHFLEHMLFMGSKKYPNENQYSAFLAQRGGSSNAYTASENTNYHFDITPDHFAEALDIFAQFFISPLLSEGSTEREVNAVENEHIKNLQSDGWRAQQLRKSLANPKHPMNKFGTGNLATLCNNTITGTSSTHCHGTRKALYKFYAEHYSPKRMRLAVLAKQPMPELLRVVQESFGGMGARGHSEPEQWHVPVRPQVGARVVKYVPIRDQRQLSLTWELPPLFSHFKSKAGSYVSHLIGHEAAGSLAALLKKRGLIESLSSGASTDQRYGASFDISVSLTEEGLKKKESVLSLIFQYIRLVREAGALKWVWQESADLAALHFRFQEKRDPAGYVVNLAANLQIYPPQYVISAPYAYEKFDPQLIAWILAQLKPDKVDIYLASPRFADTADKREPVYQTPYKLEIVDERTLKTWRDAPIDKELHLVRANVFIPRNFSMVQPPAPHSPAANKTAPVLLVDRAGARLWWKQDYQYAGKNWEALPKVNVLMQITAPYADMTARSAVLTTLWTMLYNDALVETTYDAGVAGLGWGLGASADGLKVSVSGYNDKLLLLLKQVTDPMVKCLRENAECMWAKEQRFEIVKDELRRALENSKKMSPYSRAMERLGHLLQRRVWSSERLIYELSLPSVDLDAVAEHAKEMLQRTHIEAFVHGNADADLARACLEQVSRALESFPLPDTERELQQVAKLEAGLLLADAHTNPDDLNHALELYYQVPSVGMRSDVLTALLGEMMREPCFNQLRTQEQLGYIVSCRSRPLMPTFPPAVDGISVLIQSSFKDPAGLDASAQKFVADFLANLTATEAAEAKEQEASFAAHKTSLIAEITEKETAVSQETARLWKEIVSRRYEWERRLRLVATVEPITLKEMTVFARQTLRIQAHSLAVWIYGKGMDVPEESKLIPLEQREQRTRVHSVASFKRAPPKYFPITVPTTKAAKASATAPR